MAIERFQAWVLVGSCAIAGSVSAQQTNPLIGKWHGTVHMAENYDMPYEIIYYPDNTYLQTMAVPPNRDTHTGSGTVYIRGQYRMTSDHSVEVSVAETKLCPAGKPNVCKAMPSKGGGTQTISFRMEGPDKAINTVNGQVSYRVR
jgi:hypothetical protein